MHSPRSRGGSGERIFQADSPESCSELHKGLDPTTHEIVSWAKTRNQTLDPRSHPAAPYTNLLIPCTVSSCPVFPFSHAPRRFLCHALLPFLLHFLSSCHNPDPYHLTLISDTLLVSSPMHCVFCCQMSFPKITSFIVTFLFAVLKDSTLLIASRELLALKAFCSCLQFTFLEFSFFLSFLFFPPCTISHLCFLLACHLLPGMPFLCPFLPSNI